MVVILAAIGGCGRLTVKMALISHLPGNHVFLNVTLQALDLGWAGDLFGKELDVLLLLFLWLPLWEYARPLLLEGWERHMGRVARFSKHLGFIRKIIMYLMCYVCILNYI